MTFKVRRLSYALGAEVIGVDISQPLDDKTFKEINDAFLEHQVLLFRGRTITREQHIAFSRRFGTLELNNHREPEKRVPEYPEFFLVLSKPKPTGEAATTPRAGEGWHSDNSHLPAPAAASLLHAVEVPRVGGDTMFCNMYRAYDSLSDGMKKLLQGLHGVYIQGHAYLNAGAAGRGAGSQQRPLAAAQPVIRAHAETGRTTLYVDKQIQHFVGMTAEESRPLVNFLTDYATRPQNVYRHQWQKDDLLMWYNRCALHIALPDYDRSEVRHMERTTVIGAVTGCVYDGPIG